eukprot:33115-Prymnesium_polylepis.2
MRSTCIALARSDSLSPADASTTSRSSLASRYSVDSRVLSDSDMFHTEASALAYSRRTIVARRLAFVSTAIASASSKID